MFFLGGRGVVAGWGRGGDNGAMLGFFDESGDPGLQVGGGSSRFFVAALVTFAEDFESPGLRPADGCAAGRAAAAGWV